MTAVLFGSISTLVDTSEMQRDAFNRAFAEHGLDWRWDREDYAAQLVGSGGADRIAAYAADRGQDVDAAAVHATKSRLFQESLAGTRGAARPGVVDVVRGARADGLKVGVVTTTSPENVAAVIDALAPDLSRDDFDVVVDTTDVQRRKPDGEAYTTAVARLGERPGDCVAVEDNVGGVAAAKAAGLACVAYPNANTAGHDFSAADRRVDALDLAVLQQVAGR